MPQPPFSRTISEGSGDGSGLKVEGTNSRPFGLDFLQDVISVSWAPAHFLVGGFFDNDGDFTKVTPVLMGSTDGNDWKTFSTDGIEQAVTALTYAGGTWYAGDVNGICSSKDLTKGWKRAKSLPDSVTFITSLASGQPKGHKSPIIVGVGGVGQSDSVIVTSSNGGTSWSVQEFTGDGDLFQLTSVQYCNGAFYITEAVTGFNRSGGCLAATPARIWRSVDGSSWSKSAGLSVTVAVEDEDPDLGEVFLNSSLCGVTYDKATQEYRAIGTIPYNTHVNDGGAILQKVFQIPCFATSSDGESWSKGQSYPDGNWTDTDVFSSTEQIFYNDDGFCHSIASDGNGLFVTTHSNAHAGNTGYTKTLGVWTDDNFEVIHDFPHDPGEAQVGQYGAVAWSPGLQLFCSCGWTGGTFGAGISTVGKILISAEGTGWEQVETANARLMTVAVGKIE